MKKTHGGTKVHRLGAAFLAVMLFMTVAVVPQPAWAYGRGPGTEFGDWSISKLKGKITYYLPHKNMKKGLEPYSRWYTAKGAIKNLKSSNPGVVSANLSHNGSTYEVQLSTSKPGTATISYTYKNKKYKAKITVKKYQCPFKKLTIGKYDYTSQLKKGSILLNPDDKTSGKKITVKMAKGWKLKSIEGVGKIKNGKKVPKDAGSIWIVVQNKSTGGMMEVSLLKAI